jgi:hypothetical protein
MINFWSQIVRLKNTLPLLSPKEQRVFLVKIASNQPLLNARKLVQNEDLFWYFQL